MRSKNGAKMQQSRGATERRGIVRASGAAATQVGSGAEIVWRALPTNRLPYRVDRDLLGDALGHRPAHDLAGEGACHGCEVEPPFSCGHACDAAHPKPVTLAHGESALYLGVGFLPAEMLAETGSRGFHRPARLLDGADLAPMLFKEPEPHAWPWLKGARKFFSAPFSRSSSPTFFSGFAVS